MRRSGVIGRRVSLGADGIVGGGVNGRHFPSQPINNFLSSRPSSSGCSPLAHGGQILVQALVQGGREREAGGEVERKNQQDDGQQHEDQAQDEQEGSGLGLLDELGGAVDGLLDGRDVASHADHVRNSEDGQRRTELADESDQGGVNAFTTLAADEFVHIGDVGEDGVDHDDDAARAETDHAGENVDPEMAMQLGLSRKLKIMATTQIARPRM